MYYYVTLTPLERPHETEQHICSSKDIASAIIKLYQSQHQEDPFAVSVKIKELDKTKIIKE